MKRQRPMAPPSHEPGVYSPNNPEPAEQVMRALEIKGNLPDHLDPRIQLGVQLMDLERPEYWWLRRGRSYQVGAAVAAGVGNQSWAQLVPSVLARYLVIVDQVILSNPNLATETFAVGLGSAVAAGATAGVLPRDDRHINPTQTNTTIITGNAAAPVRSAGDLVIDIPAGSSLVLNGPWIMSGNSGGLYVIGVSPVNTPIRAGFIWRERTLFQTEQ